MNQIGHHRRQAIKLALCPAVYNFYVVALNITAFSQPFEKGRQLLTRTLSRSGVDKSNYRHRRLLRTRRKRPRRRAAEQRDEVAPSHVWMAPAWQEKM